jgi:hypothetical protein
MSPFLHLSFTEELALRALTRSSDRRLTSLPLLGCERRELMRRAAPAR